MACSRSMVTVELPPKAAIWLAGVVTGPCRDAKRGVNHLREGLGVYALMPRPWRAGLRLPGDLLRE